ncbi:MULTISPECIES: hypothetical protein [Nocardiopsis]|uniref:Uncharacterized protein n=2 Tax=Nocardiopsis alba TaxID=53437 RepID=A0A7K2IVH1_9ACTN|nr:MULTISPECIES: hypothetical protein [Nocardiopsis]AFR06256.1 hypothetical protein B005_3065 [Nocardiopsis alba ATCC BAA-2165]MEC3895065.1 hypothetical protein [Nocardiopsis sp. LDBS1602]MYR33816.1 hypothetical protein [Nocardiopsis alba]
MFFIPLALWARRRMRHYPGAVRACLATGGSGVFTVCVLLGTSYGAQPPPGEEGRVRCTPIVWVGPSLWDDHRDRGEDLEQLLRQEWVDASCAERKVRRAGLSMAIALPSTALLGYGAARLRSTRGDEP